MGEIQHLQFLSVCVCVCYLGGQQRPVLPRADPSVHQVSVRDGVSRLAEQHQVGLLITTVRRETENTETLKE